MSNPLEFDRLAETVSVEGATHYLHKKGWTIGKSNRPNVICFEGPMAHSGKPLVAVLPDSETFADYSVRIKELASTLSVLEKRPASDILRDMAATGLTLTGEEDTGEPRQATMSQNPFHYRGPIEPRYEAAWEAMRWHETLITNVLRDLDQDPPEYIFVLAPASSGKTTFANQLMDYAAAKRPTFLFVYVDLFGLGGHVAEPGSVAGSVAQVASAESVVFSLEPQFTQRVSDVLINEAVQDSGRFEPDSREQVLEILREAESDTHDGFDDLLDRLLPVLHQFDRVVLLIDNLATLHGRLREDLFNRLRQIHLRRLRGSLRRFSVVMLDECLQRSCDPVSPLANVVRRIYRLEDFTRNELRQFLAKCGEVVENVIFEPRAVDYLYDQAGGHAVMIQRICEAAVRRRVRPDCVTLDDVLEGIASCYEERRAVIAKLLDTSRFDGRTRMLLFNDILYKKPVLHLEYLPHISDLVDAGLVTKGPNRRSIMRSPLLRGLFIKRNGVRQDEYPELPFSQIEECLLDLPQVMSLICDEPLQNRVHNAVLSLGQEDRLIGFRTPANTTGGDGSLGMGQKEPRSTLEDLVAEILDHEKLPLDLEGIRFFFDRYFRDMREAELTRHDIFRLLVKVCLKSFEADQVTGTAKS